MKRTAVIVLCLVAQWSFALKFGAAPVISQKGNTQVQKVLLTIDISNPYREINDCLKVFEQTTKGESSDHWGVYVKVGTPSPFYISKRNVCATSTSCDDGICFVEPSSGKVFSPTTEAQRKSFPKFQYVGKICATTTRGKDKPLNLTLESSAGAFSTMEHAVLSFDEAVRKLPDAKVVEYGGLILNRGYFFYRTSLIKGTQDRSVVSYPKSLQVFADKDGTLWTLNTTIECQFVPKGKPLESRTEEYENVLSIVGRWHSHPQGNDTAGFSGTDYDSFVKAGIPSYLSDSGEVLRLSNTDEKPGDVMSIARTEDGGFALAEKKFEEDIREKYSAGGEGTDVYLPDAVEEPVLYRNPSVGSGGSVRHAPVTSKEFYGKPSGSFFK